MKKLLPFILLLLFVGFAFNTFSQEWKWRDDFDYSATMRRVLQKTQYSRLVFNDYADFRLSTLSPTADFLFVEFNSEAYFNGAEFVSTVDFFGAKFSSKAIFRDAKFDKTAEFYEGFSRFHL